jgi:hypothetical protein
VGRVLDHGDAAGLGHRADGVQVRGMAGVVHGEDGARARGEGALHRARVEVQRVGLDVHEHGARAHVLDDVHRGREGDAGGDDLVARPDAERHERRVQAGGARVERQRARRAQRGGELGLEARGLGPRGDPVRAERVHHLVDLLVADGGRREREELGPAGQARGDRHPAVPARA